MKNKKKLSRRITVAHDPKSGKEIRVRVYGNSNAELDRNIYLARRKAEQNTHRSQITFFDYANRWVKLYKNHVEQKTCDMYFEALKKTAALDSIYINLITKDDIQTIINQHFDHPRACQKLGIVLNQIFQAAVEDGFITKNPCKHIILPKYVPAKKRALFDTEITAIKNAALDTRQRVWMDMLYYLGLRPEEARGLRKRSFDWKNQHVLINQAIVWKNNRDVVVKSTKNHKIRKIPIPNIVLERIQSYVSSCKTTYLFVGTTGEPFTEWEYRQFASDILNQIYLLVEEPEGTDHMTFYTCRHNYATHLYYNGVVPGKISLKMAAYLMGHTEQVFLKTYAHMDERLEDVQAVIELI